MIGTQHFCHHILQDLRFMFNCNMPVASRLCKLEPNRTKGGLQTRPIGPLVTEHIRTRGLTGNTGRDHASKILDTDAN